MKITVDISDEELKSEVLQIIAGKYYREFSADRRSVNKVTAECVREIIYKDKAEIVDRIVGQASRECKNKAVKKLLESLEE